MTTPTTGTSQFNRDRAIAGLTTLHSAGALEGHPGGNADFKFEDLTDEELRWYYDNWTSEPQEQAVPSELPTDRIARARKWLETQRGTAAWDEGDDLLEAVIVHASDQFYEGPETPVEPRSTQHSRCT